MARFHINHSFKLRFGDQQSFVLAGQITEGAVRKGMEVRIPFNSQFAMSVAVDRIEFARRGDGRDDVCLCFDCNEEDLDLWEGLNLADEEVDVMEPNSPTATPSEKDRAIKPCVATGDNVPS